MQKASDKRLEQPELPENLCVICFMNVSERRFSSFCLANNVFFSSLQEENDLPHVDSNRIRNRDRSLRVGEGCSTPLRHKL